ncbi:MAG TPA: hydrogenase maturation protease [Micromonosporaceae bacterium]|nr:hydrogenase maturation protease [Micromonosporaceae bacterium]
MAPGHGAARSLVTGPRAHARQGHRESRPTAGMVVIGVGNPLRRDDGVGPAVIELLRAMSLPGVALATSLGGGAELVSHWDGRALVIVVDAVRSWPAHPGRVHRLAVPRSGGERTRAASSHGIGLGNAVQLAEETGRLPERLVLYAVEAADIGDGAGLTPAVQASAERLADEIAVVAWAARQARAVPAGPAR